MAKVKLGKYEVDTDRRCNKGAIWRTAYTFRDLLCDELSITDEKDQARLVQRMFKTISGYHEGEVLWGDIVKYSKVKKIPADIRKLIKLDELPSSTDDKKTSTKKTTKKRKAVEVEVEDTATGETYSVDEAAQMAGLKGVSLELYVKFLKLEGHTVVAK